MNENIIEGSRTRQPTCIVSQLKKEGVNKQKLDIN